MLVSTCLGTVLLGTPKPLGDFVTTWVNVNTGRFEFNFSPLAFKPYICCIIVILRKSSYLSEGWESLSVVQILEIVECLRVEIEPVQGKVSESPYGLLHTPHRRFRVTAVDEIGELFREVLK